MLRLILKRRQTPTGTDSMTDKARVESIEPIFSGRAVTLQREHLQLPNGTRTDLEIVRHPGGSATVAFDDRDNVCLIHQYRHAVNDWLWELPAGKLEPGESAQSTAARELEEEAGVRAADWTSLGMIVTSPAICDERIYLFRARELVPVEICHEADEVIEIHWFTLQQAMEMIRNGDITDAKTVTGLLRAGMNLSDPGA